MADEHAYRRACEKVGVVEGPLPSNRTRFFKQVVALASKQAAAAPSTSSKTTSPVKLVSSASHASAIRPTSPAIKDLTAGLTAGATVASRSGDAVSGQAGPLADEEVLSLVSPLPDVVGGESDLGRFLDPSPDVSATGLGTSTSSSSAGGRVNHAGSDAD